MTDVTVREHVTQGDPPGSSGRMPALDGLRGAASFVVLTYHCLLCVPSLTVAYRPDEAGARSHGATALGWWLSHSPLRLLWAGTEAVFVFFVLSGLVLVLPALKPGFSWRTYYPRRLVRIYLPVFGALLFALVLVAVLPRRDMDELSPWLAHVAGAPTLRSFARDSLLLSGMESLIGPLWSLRFEMLFSLLLPAYVLVVRRAGAAVQPWLVVAAVVASFVGYVLPQTVLFYMPMFAVGALLAVQRRRLTSWWAARSAGAHRALALAALAALVGPWLIAPWVPPVVTSSSMGLQVVGACGVVVLAMVHAPTQRLLCGRRLQGAGRISFSLYLIHEPIVIAAAVVLGPGHGWWVLPVAAPLSVLAALAFFRWVEAPSHRLAQSLQRR